MKSDKSTKFVPKRNNMNIKILFSFLALLAFSSCSDAQKTTDNSTGTKIVRASLSEFKSRMQEDNTQLLDVRTDDEYNAGHIADAKQIDYFSADFKDQIAQLDKQKPVLIYCASGNRSSKAIDVMKTMGFTEIVELQGGYNAWDE